MLYELLNELREEVGPLFIQPLIEQGMADGSIKTECPKELAEMLALFINLWINPLVCKASKEETINKCMLFSKMLGAVNLDVIDDEIISKLNALSEII